MFFKIKLDNTKISFMSLTVARNERVRNVLTHASLILLLL